MNKTFLIHTKCIRFPRLKFQSMTSQFVETLIESSNFHESYVYVNIYGIYMCVYMYIYQMKLEQSKHLDVFSKIYVYIHVYNRNNTQSKHLACT